MPPSRALEKRPKLLLLDGYSLAFRAFFALPEDLTTSDGTRTNAVYGFTSMLIKMLQDESPDYVACCMDKGAPLQRTEEYTEYKAGRSEAPDIFKSQVPLIREVLRVMRIPVYELEGHEADDIISFLAKKAASEGIDVRIVTGDRDFFQLVNDDIHVLYNRRGITDIVDMDAQAVQERYGVPPEKYVDLKALEGDNSDNLPGVPGVGTKTASKLVQKYGSAEGAVAHADEQTPKLAKNLAAHADQVALNKKLSVLAATAVPDAEVDQMKVGTWDLDEIRELFTSLEFRSLLERLLSDMPEIGVGEGKPFELQVTVYEDPRQLAAELEASSGFSMDVVPSAPRGAPRSLAFSWGDGRVGFLPMGSGGAPPPEVAGAIGAVLADEAVPARVHDGREAILALGAIGVSPAGIDMDTHIAAYVLEPGSASGYPLEEVARRYAGRELKAARPVPRDEERAQGSFNLDAAGGEAEAEEACLRALAVSEVAEAVTGELERLRMLQLYRDIELPLVPVLARMEQVGVALDLDYLHDVSVDLDKQIGKLEEECYELAGERLNLGSPTQLRVLLYEKLGLKTKRRTKTGLSTDARALQTLVDEHPFVARLLEYRELAKLKNTYVDALPPLVDERDRRLHTTYEQTVAATGRLSSTNPNLMNIPIRTELGLKIRRAFVPEPGYVLLSADYSQIELRVMAHLSEDPILLEVFRTGKDVHSETAARVFSTDPGRLTVGQRSMAKMVNYGLTYGMGASGLAERLNVPVAEAREVMGSYFEQFGGVKRFLDEVVTQAHADGFTTTMFGRRRYLPELGSGNPRIRAIGERQALNAPIQGSAADIMKLAMINVARRLEEESSDMQMILTVHDELVFEVPEGMEAEAEKLVREEMCGVADMKVPLEVDVSSGTNWADAKG